MIKEILVGALALAIAGVVAGSVTWILQIYPDLGSIVAAAVLLLVICYMVGSILLDSRGDGSGN